MTNHIVIVGAGFSGLGLAISLKRAGIDDFTLLERAPTLGGVWRDNRYPGVACDIESHLYSYSFEPNPRWSRTYAPQREILAYLEHCADEFDVRRHIRFDTAVTAARFDDTRGIWIVTTNHQETIDARLLVSGSGHALTKPVLPDLEGRDSFAGRAFHSARWDESFSLENKRVAVIGTGASAIQIVPHVAKMASKLHVFQRSAPWVVPKPDGEISPRAQAMFERFPPLQLARRELIYWRHELLALGFVASPKVLKWAGPLALGHMRKTVKDPTLRRKLTPDYVMGCKRILPSNEFYPAMVRPNVELVTDRIARVVPEGLVTADGKTRELDAIVYATGFEAAEAEPPFDLRGRNERSLADEWKQHAAAYLGSTMSGFPNFFFLLGPNTGLGHSSMTLMMESQFAYLVDAVRTLRAKKLATIEVRPDVVARYNDELQQRLTRSVWNTGGCVSWYRTKAGRNTTLWPGYTFEFRRRTKRFDLESYEAKAA